MPDEMVGAYGAMANGALIGATFGGAPGAAVGAAVGGAAEVEKVWEQGFKVADELKLSANAFSDSFAERQKQMVDEKSILKSGQTSADKLAELQQALQSAKTTLGGQQKNLTDSKAEYNSNWLPSWLSPSTAASKNDMDFDKKNVATLEKTIKDLEQQIKYMANGGGGGATINPTTVPSFAVGAGFISKGGLATIHAGEMIVPKAEVAELGEPYKNRLVESGMINAGAFEDKQANNALNEASVKRMNELMLLRMPEVPYTFKRSTQPEPQKNVEKPLTTGLGMGLFDRTNISGAMSGGINRLEKDYQSSNEQTKEKITDKASSYTNGLTNVLSNAFSAKTKESPNKPVIDTGKGLYYSDATQSAISNPLGTIIEALMQAQIGQAIQSLVGGKSGKTSSNLMNYSDDTKSMVSSNLMDYSDTTSGLTPTNTIEDDTTQNGTASTNLIDYSDDIRGEVSPALLNMRDYEDRVAQEKYGSMPSGGMIQGMDTVEDYLAEENTMTKTMIRVLESIERALLMTQNSPTDASIGDSYAGLPPESGMKMRRVAQEQSSGEWDLSFGDHAPSSVTMS